MADDDRTELEITDPVALRALAHPARQQLITELFAGEVLTATEAAEIVGLTPSATSYHLRALEKFGIVTRGEASTDARQRPWRAVADSISVQPEALRGAGRATSLATMTEWFSDMDAGLARSLRAIEAGVDDVGHTSRGTARCSVTARRCRLWLTESEVTDLRDRLIGIVREYEGRTRGDHPEDAQLWDVYSALLPAEGRPEE